MNIDIFLRIVFAALVAAFVAFAATPIVKVFSHKIGAVDIPADDRRVHKKPMPRLGGLAIFYGFIVSILCFAEIDRALQGILIGAVIIVSLGVLDDCLNLPAWLKFFVQIGAAGVVVTFGVQIQGFNAPLQEYLPLGYWSIPVTIIWIVGITNAVNLMDGLDGLAAGICAITAVTLVTVSLVTGNYNMAVLTIALAGACIGFIPYNFFPASIFMGDTGSTFLGFILACISINGLFKAYAVISFAVPFLVLAIPIFDTGFAIIRRIYKRQSPMQGDRGHLHHRLIDMGFTQKQAVLVLYVTSALLSMSAVVLIISGAARAMVLMMSVLLLTLAGKQFVSAVLEDEGDK